MTDETHNTIPLRQDGKIVEVLRAMLFVSTDPLTINELSGMLYMPADEIRAALDELSSSLTGSVQLMQISGGYQLCTRPEYASYCTMILQPASKRLSQAAFETLAIIAYRQPCTIPEAEAVRGVAVSGVVKTLLDRGLVKEVGRKKTPGRPMMYATTGEFLEYFGLNDIKDLPEIEHLQKTLKKDKEADTQLPLL